MKNNEVLDLINNLIISTLKIDFGNSMTFFSKYEEVFYYVKLGLGYQQNYTFEVYSAKRENGVLVPCDKLGEDEADKEHLYNIIYKIKEQWGI